MENEIVHIPEPTLRRLVRYLHFLQKQTDRDSKMVSSTVIAEHLNLDSVQVRKDLQYTRLPGRPKTGWIIDELIVAIENTLGWNNFNDAFLVGAGQLGATLLGYEGFRNYGFNFVAAFDVSPKIVGKTINGIQVLHSERIVDLARRMHTHIGVITVPADAAQESANALIEGGILAIWNFSPTQIEVPEHIIVVNAQFSQDIAVIANKLSVSLKSKLGV